MTMKEVTVRHETTPPIKPITITYLDCPECGSDDIRAYETAVRSHEIDKIESGWRIVYFVEAPTPTHWEHAYFMCQDCETKVTLPYDWQDEYR